LIWLQDFTSVKPRVDSSLHNNRLVESYIYQNDHLKKMYLKEHDFLLKILLKFSKSLHSKLFFHVFPKEVFLNATVNMWRQYTACHRMITMSHSSLCQAKQDTLYLTVMK